MANSLRLYHLGLSPNGKRARLALGVKELVYDSVDVDPRDRNPVVEISGQPLTPVLVHGETVVFDSWAILRYLEANLRREPRLYAAERERMQAIEDWERFSRTELGPPVRAMFAQVISGDPDGEALTRAAAAYGDAIGELDRALTESGSAYLLGDSPCAADVACAALLNIAWLTPAAVEAYPLVEVFHEHLAKAPGSNRLRAWYASLDARDVFRVPQELPPAEPAS
jgi:glutathione S-transferase